MTDEEKADKIVGRCLAWLSGETQLHPDEERWWFEPYNGRTRLSFLLDVRRQEREKRICLPNSKRQH